MPLYLRHYSLLLWIALSWTNLQVTNADITKYGMRIRPISAVPSVLRTNATSTDTKPKSALRSPTSNINQESSDAKGTVKETKFQYRNLYHTLRPLVKTQQTSLPSYYDSPKDNPKRGATFFFTQVEPHRFEYRAMFQHERNQHSNTFQPFVDFDAFSKEFPPLPNFHTFPQFQEPKDAFPNFFSDHKSQEPKNVLPNFFSEHKSQEPKNVLPNFFSDHKPQEPKDVFPNFFTEHKDPFPNFNKFSFPTLPPAIKRAWHPSADNDSPPKEIKIDLPRTILNEKLEGPLLKNYDIVLGHMQYPKIFRFNEERVNIEDFDRQKKVRFYSLGKKEQNELLEPENVKRNELLILHGGIFTVQEPPLFKNKHPKKRRKLGGYGSYRQRLNI